MKKIKKIFMLLIFMVLGVYAHSTLTQADTDKWFVGTTSAGAILDSDGNYTVTGDLTAQDDLAITGDATVGGALTVTGALTGTAGFVLPVVSTATAPSEAGILAVNSSYVVYIATGTGTGEWVLVGSQS